MGSNDVIVACFGMVSSWPNMAIKWGSSPTVVAGLKCLQTMYRSEFACRLVQGLDTYTSW